MLNVGVRPHRCETMASGGRHGSLFALEAFRSSSANWEAHVSFALYTIGFVIMIVGLIYGATLLHMPTRWIVVGTVVLLGLGIVKAVTATRQRDPSS